MALIQREIEEIWSKGNEYRYSDEAIQRVIDTRQQDEEEYHSAYLTNDEESAIACWRMVTGQAKGSQRMSDILDVKLVVIKILCDDPIRRRLLDEEFKRQNPNLPTTSPEEIERLKRLPYRKYLQSDHWDRTRKACYAAAGNRCQLCYSDGEIHAHHRTYERRGCELPSDVIALCEPCHAKFHDKLPKEPH